MTVLVLLIVSILFTAAEARNLVLLKDSGEAVCLDGSPPGYYFKAGNGAGKNKWILYMQQGGWCYDEKDCLKRSKTTLGSSKNWPLSYNYPGLLMKKDEFNQGTNQKFIQWNWVHINYCDGASFAGYVKKAVDVNGAKIYFRGFKILQAVMQSLMEKGMSKADEVLLSGCSAGGLATYLHADYVKSLFSPSVKFHALADAGYFIDAPNIHGEMHIRRKYAYVFNMQNCSGGVDQDCINAYKGTGETWKCFMAQYTYPYVSVPLFTFNSQIDPWQLDNILQLGCVPPVCTQTQMAHLQNYHEKFKKAAAPIINSKVNGAFLDSCVRHCQAVYFSGWYISIQGQSAATTFLNWYNNNNSGSKSLVDCHYPCNKSC